jgi:esterase/lipase superfamily enzyme
VGVGDLAAPAPREAAAAREMTAAEKARLQALAGIKGSAIFGALGGSSFAESTPHNVPQVGQSASGNNPLRAQLSSLPIPQPSVPNPLREERIAPRLAAAPPSPSVPPPSPKPPPAAADPPSANPPSGGATRLSGGLEEIARAFGAAEPSSGASGAIPPPATVESAMAAGSSISLSGSVAPPAAPTNNNPFDVVEVFYGTDRQSADAPVSDWRHVLLKYVPMATAALVALGIGLVASGRRGWILWAACAVGIVISLGLGYHASADALAIVRSAGKQGPQYTTQRSPSGLVELGRCEVTIPKSHERGELEAPSILRLEIVEDAADHVILQKTERLADAEFYQRLKSRVEQSDRRELFVFIHGFNVSFVDAARRTAQIHHDLQFDGAPIFFSWPANDKFIFTYPADETNVAWSVPHLKQFLLGIVKESQAKSINLIAHSMGNRALSAALREIDLELRDKSRLFNQVILAAPDIDADDFRNNIAPAMQRTAQRLTLYASSHDDALMASQIVHRGPRAGDAGDGLIVISGIDTIDVTAIDSSLWGHAYYGSSHPVLHDLRALLSRAIPPSDRTWLSPAQRDGLTYWIFQPTRTATADSTSTR